MKTLTIYGAGYTGGMAAEHAASAGLDLVLASREQDRRCLRHWSARLGRVSGSFRLAIPMRKRPDMYLPVRFDPASKPLAVYSVMALPKPSPTRASCLGNRSSTVLPSIIFGRHQHEFHVRLLG
ncbi:MAG: hypothetical protein E5X80_06290 [Mesorhizobium sp.]|nr:MAG: hypothetical protein EOR71_10510 [Mesorhizobium sp.]TIO61683.1 MAG: hypothetical protein E5X79_06385 [Mesorhizobium sp.]TJV66385.1 MAG: hypothetical protein E5X80_06290 [Mesorhizobium sp.]